MSQHLQTLDKKTGWMDNQTDALSLQSNWVRSSSAFSK